MRAIGLTDIGLVRTSNQDSYLIDEDKGLFVVCDGMGGHKGGDVASSLAIKAIRDSLSDYREDEPLKWLNQSVSRANDLIREWGQNDPDLFEMGTTITAAIIKEQELIIAHVGDSRLYHINNKGINKVTRDHTLAEQMITDGLLKAEETSGNAYNHILTRALGIDNQVLIDNLAENVMPGDIILLCTDGLSDMLQESDILTTINEFSFDIAVAARKLIERALNNGGYDNVTVILVLV
jgi:protein phosphatase